MGTSTLKLLACLLAITGSVSSERRADAHGAHFHQHSDTELDSVQCHHSESWVTPEPSTGQESRLAPARQYLPAVPAKPKEEEAPAATFQQPSFLTVERTLVSPSTQKNYNLLFGSNKPDIVPSAAQNVPNALAPPAPRRTGDKKHSHEDDEDNLERLCNDAFHSFLCKPIKGPRKTPTGRLRANAVIPPDVLAGLSSLQSEARVKPEAPKLQPAPNNVQNSFAKPSPYLPPVQPQPQRIPKPISTTLRPSTAPAPFIDILKEDNQEVPSPSNTDQLIIKPHDCEKSKPTTPEIPKPTFYQKPVSLKPVFPTTQKPFVNPYNFKPSVPLPSNNVPKLAYPFQTTPPHDCEKSKPLVPSPSYQKQVFNVPSFPTTTAKPYNFQYNVPLQTNNIPKIAPPPKHDCEKSRSTLPPVVANPSNNDPVSVKPYSPPTFKPSTNNFNSYSFNSPKSTLAPLKPSPTPLPPHDCEKQKLRASNTNPNPFFIKPYNPPTFKPIGFKSPEKPSIPLPSNNIPQIIAQPQQIKSVTVSPSAPTGYVYDRPAIPFPSDNNPSLVRTTTQSPFRQPSGYVYDQPKIPFPSNNIPQIVTQPPAIPTTQKPCEHNKSNPEEGNPTNHDIVILKPSSTSDAYVYDKPNIPFPPERTGPSNQIPVSLKPVSSTPNPTTGYNYDKPANPLLLPNPSNNFRNIAPSPANNGYNYQKPAESFPSTTISSTNGYKYNKPNIPFPSSINSQLEDSSNESPNFVAKPQTRVDVAVRPGYSYDKPNNPLLTPDSSNQNGYSYPKPQSAFIR